VCVRLGQFTVRRPTRMPDVDRALQRLGGELGLEISELALASFPFSRVATRAESLPVASDDRGRLPAPT
jgi:hypothetical protein